MIHDTLDNADLYQVLHPRLATALRYIAQFEPDTEDGWYDIDGDSVRARPHTYVAQPQELRRWETHRRYVDVQYIVSGREYIQYSNVQELVEPSAYDDEKDVIHYEAARSGVSTILLNAGEFVIFYQHDGHKPSIAVAANESVRKIVVKVDLG